jgi:hypothetical protein
LSDWSKSSKYIVHFLSCDLIGQITDKYNFVDFWSESYWFLLCPIDSSHL